MRSICQCIHEPSLSHLQKHHEADPLLLEPGTADELPFVHQLVQMYLNACDVVWSVDLQKVLMAKLQKLDESCPDSSNDRKRSRGLSSNFRLGIADDGVNVSVDIATCGTRSWTFYREG